MGFYPEKFGSVSILEGLYFDLNKRIKKYIKHIHICTINDSSLNKTKPDLKGNQKVPLY